MGETKDSFWTPRLFIWGFTTLCLIAILFLCMVYGLVYVGIYFGLKLVDVQVLVKISIFILISIVLFVVWFWKNKIMSYSFVGDSVGRLIHHFPSLTEYVALKFAYYILAWLSFGGFVLDNLWFLSNQTKSLNALWPGASGFNWLIIIAIAFDVLGFFLVAFIGLGTYLVSSICGSLFVANVIFGFWNPTYIEGPLANIFSGATSLMFGCLLLISFDTKLTRR
jgi:hypothetical protein